jgi:hypothetical protein
MIALLDIIVDSVVSLSYFDFMSEESRSPNVKTHSSQQDFGSKWWWSWSWWRVWRNGLCPRTTSLHPVQQERFQSAFCPVSQTSCWRIWFSFPWPDLLEKLYTHTLSLSTPDPRNSYSFYLSLQPPAVNIIVWVFLLVFFCDAKHVVNTWFNLWLDERRIRCWKLFSKNTQGSQSEVFVRVNTFLLHAMRKRKKLYSLSSW